jgi:hypothetical protein
LNRWADRLHDEEQTRSLFFQGSNCCGFRLLPEKIRLRRKTFRVRLDLEARLDKPAQNAPSAANFLQEFV